MAAKEPKEPTVGGKMITYTPKEDGDRPFVLWNAHRFEANKPKLIADPLMIAAAITNPWFKVEGHPQAKRVKPTGSVPPPGSNEDRGDDEMTDAELDKMVEVE